MEYAGSLHVADIGFPRNLTDSPELRVELVDREYAKARLAVRRDRDAHKGSAGHLLLVGGFDHMEGAIILSALAALQAGVGLATVLSTERARGIIAGVVPELITRSLRPEGGSGAVITAGEGEGALRKGIEEGLDAFFAEDRRYDAAVIGPGMGRGPFSRLVFEAFMGRAAGSKVKRVVVDGDGLYHLAALKKRGSRGKEAQVIITPHFAEASRLCGRAVDEIKRDRPRAAVELARETGAVTLLKGPASIVSDGEYSLVNSTGNPALATAGSGDVLAGIIGALLLRELPPLEAAGLGAYIHGLAADLCVERSRLEILKATDILGCIREAVRRTVDDAGTL
jgi:NAD(P)H-hydrate epimerase